MYPAKKELGIGDGVSRDVICSLFKEFLPSYTVGCNQIVPVIRHTMLNEDWKAVGRIIIYGLKLNYFPIKISPVFMLSALFGEEMLDEKMLIESFLQYISNDERNLLSLMLDKYSNDDEKIEELLDLLSSYKCFRAPNELTLPKIISEISHQELVQKPRYLANAITEVFNTIRNQPFSTREKLLDFYNKKKVASRGVIKCLSVSPGTESEKEVIAHLKRFIKSLEPKELGLFLTFITGADIISETEISVVFTEDSPRMPRARTCIPQLELQNQYSCYNELAEGFFNILRDPFCFSSSS